MKAILEIEAPESCEECGLYRYKRNLTNLPFCMGCNKVLGNLGDRAPFCPLKYVPEPETPEASETPLFKDMTLRDYFAGQALAGLLADANYRPPLDGFGKKAYVCADAMLAAREGGKP